MANSALTSPLSILVVYGDRYLRALRDWDRRFPGFGHETHGVEVDGGAHYLRCLTQQTR